jgi:pyruvate formate-lyase activating enzyme-like uncharacterized protein
MEKTRYFSYKQNRLAKGCQLCVQGRKSVLFITGLCPEKCFYCPISDQKHNKDVIYINEWHTRSWKNIIKEIQLCQSRGVGITGGDPLAKLDRTLSFIQKLKKEFGKKFHIHLYTPFTLVNESTLRKLSKAGLDEIRFHPNLETPKRKNWQKILIAKKFGWQVGIEIPVIPKKEELTKGLINYIADKIDFLNLNELEYSDTNASKLAEKGYKTRDNISYAIEGSRELAFKLLKYIEKKYPKLNVHFCTAKLKDHVQMRNRIRLRAESIKKPFDRVSPDGTLIRGAIYLKALLPGKKYKKKLAKLNDKKRQKLLKKLGDLKETLEDAFDIGPAEIDTKKMRLLLSEKIARQLSKEIKPKRFRITVTEEYSTHDEFEVELDFLQ